jgi:hypothetical protein
MNYRAVGYTGGVVVGIAIAKAMHVPNNVLIGQALGG